MTRRNVARLADVCSQVVEFYRPLRAVPHGLPNAYAHGLCKAAFVKLPVEIVAPRRAAARKERKYRDAVRLQRRSHTRHGCEGRHEVAERCDVSARTSGGD